MFVFFQDGGQKVVFAQRYKCQSLGRCLETCYLAFTAGTRAISFVNSTGLFKAFLPLVHYFRYNSLF